MVAMARGGRVELVHRGHAVICDGSGAVVEAWGAPETVIYPRSSCKMIQALPLFELGAARDLSDGQPALACASHQGEALHATRRGRLARVDRAGRRGPALRRALALFDTATAADLIRADERPCQLHNNCSGKHAGFLTLSRHLRAGPDYVEPDHPVQSAIRAAFEEVTGMASPGYGIDGCSAPNYATRLDALGGAMGRFARAREGVGARTDAMARLVRSMGAAPELVAGEGRACTDLMRAMGGRVAVKTGAEAVYVAVAPGIDRGVAVKIVDGGTRAAEAVIAALLVRLGLLEAGSPVARRLTRGPVRNARGIETGHVQVRLA